MAQDVSNDAIGNDAPADVRETLRSYAAATKQRVDHFADIVCPCGGTRFAMIRHDRRLIAIAICQACGKEQSLIAGGEARDDAFSQCQCQCGSTTFEITVGSERWRDTHEILWGFIGLRCVACGRATCGMAWNNAILELRRFLARVFTRHRFTLFLTAIVALALLWVEIVGQEVPSWSTRRMVVRGWPVPYAAEHFSVPYSSSGRGITWHLDSSGFLPGWAAVDYLSALLLVVCTAASVELFDWSAWKRRQFTLAGLFRLTTVIALVLGYLTVDVEIARASDPNYYRLAVDGTPVYLSLFQLPLYATPLVLIGVVATAHVVTLAAFRWTAYWLERRAARDRSSESNNETGTVRS